MLATGTWQTVVGIILVVLSVFNLPRGLIGIVITLTQPGMVSPAEPLGVAVLGAALLAAGISLIVRGARIRRTNRAAVAAAQQGYPTA